MSGLLSIEGIKKETEGQRDQSLADLQIYLQAPVGVGEHGGICEEIKTKLRKISDLDSILSTIDEYIKTEPNDATASEPKNDTKKT